MMLTNIQDTVRTLIIPLQGRNLLLPNVAVAEVIPYIRPRAIDDAPEWLLGAISWRGLTIPLISFDRLHGQEDASTLAQARIAVFNSVQSGSGLGFYAVVTAGIPQLKRVNADAMQELSAEAADGILSQVQIGDIQTVIPDLAALESVVADGWKRVA
jgi:chemosensory pili system protein ChpC